MFFLLTFVIHAIRRFLTVIGWINTNTFVTLQIAVFSDFVLFLIPIIYVLNVHRQTFNTEAIITHSFASIQRSPSNSIQSDSRIEQDDSATDLLDANQQFRRSNEFNLTVTERNDTAE